MVKYIFAIGLSLLVLAFFEALFFGDAAENLKAYNFTDWLLQITAIITFVSLAIIIVDIEKE